MVTKSAEKPGIVPEGILPGSGQKRPGTIQVVEFLLGDERFAIDLFDVKEVVEYTPITKIPRVPPYIRGIIDLRGEVITIIDLKQRLNIAGADNVASEASRIIVLDTTVTGARKGILVDDVTSVSTFEPGQVDNTSASINREETAILGIIKRKARIRDKEKNELIIWIDIKKLLGDIETGT
jgi:purine-binding chemotaxis protein CheW